ncbi:nuclear pore complex protein Nup153-like isoform X2 [Mizuhopecten yessoensis]|uniref:nuclear pore complex protein Nup153-like isoform X2 n=1 Tax=Mizuhopecten yessoensis TaxID=6573 RepID=UPI000B45C926|nr:nuclear pore complex protein Nup153-like isoform X2 [Mizuhopecten yessoensis]
MSEEGGGKIRNKKLSNPPKPYEKRKSFLGKVTDTVKELISPSWLSDLVNSVKKTSPQKEDEQPVPPTQEPQYMSSLQSHQHHNRNQVRDGSQFSPPKFVPLTRNGLANLSPRSSLPLIPSLPPQQPPLQQSQPPLTFCNQSSDVGEISRKSHAQPSIFLSDSKSVDGNRNFLSNCTVGRGRLDNEGFAGSSDASARPGPSNTEVNPADISTVCNHNESMEGDEQEESLPVSVNRLNKSTTWTEGFNARKPRSSSRNKPGFDISLFGVPLHNNSLLGDSSHESSFYPGKTTYGGASAQRKPRLNVTGPYQASFPMRQKMKVKPVNTSTSAATSSTAQKILETLEKMSTPLSEARKIPNDDTVLRLNSSFNPTNYKPARHSIGSYLNTRRELQKSQSGPPTGKVSTPVPASISRNYQRVTVPQTQPGKNFLNEKTSMSTIQQIPQEKEKMPSSASGGGKLKSKKFQQHFPGRKSAEDDDEEVEMSNLRTDFTLPVVGIPQFDFGTSQSTKPVEGKGNKPNSKYTFATPIQKTPTKQADQVSPTKIDFTFSSPLSMDIENGVKPKSVTFDIEPVKVQESPAAFSPPAFKFGSPLGLKSSSNLGASPVLPKSSGGMAPATELKSGSVMDVLGKSGGSGFSFNTGSSTNKINSETSSMGGFKPASELKQGSVMDVLGGTPKTSSSSFGSGFQPAKDLKKGSVMDVLGKSSQEDSKPGLSTMFKVAEGSWECDVCCINNKADVSKCAACGAKKPGGSGNASVPSSQPSLSSMFKVAEGSWTCDACMVQNKSADTKCVACQTKKPGASGTPASSSQPSLSSMFKVAEGSWTCDACMVQNKSADTKCAACQTKKPGATGSANSPIKDSLVSKFKRPTGNWECDTCLVPNNATATKCIACETPRPGLQPSSSFGLKFGGVSVKNTTSLVGQSGFKFGVSNKDSSDTKSTSSSGAGQLSFGIPVSSSNSTSESSKSSTDVAGGIKFGTGEISSGGGASVGGFKFGSASSTPTVTPTTGFKIGSLAAPKSDALTGGFQMPSAKSSPAVDISQNKTDSSSTFKSLFGVDKSEITSGPKTDSTSGKVSNGSVSIPVSSSPAVGFQFGAPTKSLPPFSTGSGFTVTKSSEETPKPMPLFNVQSPASTAAAPSLKRSHNEENGPSDAKRASFNMFTAGTTAEPAKSVGNNILFGSTATVPAATTQASIFQAPTAPTSTLSTTASTAPTGGFSFGMGGNSASTGGIGTSSFGETAKNPPGFNFSAETNKTSVFSFGAGSGTATATTAPVFGASANNTVAKTSASSAPFSFTAQSSIPATPFGSAQESTHAFAANTSGFGSTPNMFAGSNNTPSFGASGAVPPSGFGAAATGFNTTSAGNTPAFGAATTTANANTGSTGGFNFASQQQGFNFSAQQSTVNNGVFQFGAKPGEGTPAAAPPQAPAGFNFNASSTPGFNFGQSTQPAMPVGTGSFNIGSNNDASSGRKIKKAVRKIRR